MRKPAQIELGSGCAASYSAVVNSAVVKVSNHNRDVPMIPRLALGALTLLAALFTSVVAQGAELLMFDDPGCVWCRRWNAEIAPSYPKTREGQQAPLRRVPIRDQARAGVRARPMLSGAIFSVKRCTPSNFATACR